VLFWAFATPTNKRDREPNEIVTSSDGRVFHTSRYAISGRESDLEREQVGEIREQRDKKGDKRGEIREQRDKKRE